MSKEQTETHTHFFSNVTKNTMNLDNLTFGELKTIAGLFGTTHQGVKAHPFAGKYVICRCFGAGVHAGELVSMDGTNVILKDSRRLWSWKAKSGIALSGLAQNGLVPGHKIDTMNPLIALTDVIECIPATTATQNQINAA